MAKLPSFQFYPGDWMKDPALRACSIDARGLWMDMLCLMFESDRRGFLQAPNGKPYSHDQLARMTGCSTDEISRLLAELETSGVYSRTKNGTIFSRRLKRDEELRADHRKRQHDYRNSHKTIENSDANVTPTVTTVLHPSSSSSSSSKQQPLPLPDFIKPELYAAWREVRMKIRNAPFTERAESGIIADLAKLKEWGIDPNERLHTALTRGWRGVLFEDDKPRTGLLAAAPKPKTQYEIDADQQREERREAVRKAAIQ